MGFRFQGFRVSGLGCRVSGLLGSLMVCVGVLRTLMGSCQNYAWGLRESENRPKDRSRSGGTGGDEGLSPCAVKVFADA